MEVLHEEKYVVRDKVFEIIIDLKYSDNPMDEYFGTMFDEFLGYGYEFMETKFSEFMPYIKGDKFEEFIKDIIMPHLIISVKQLINKNFDEFQVCSFPLRLEFLIVDIYQANSLTNKNRADYCSISLKATDIFVDYIVNKYKNDRERRIFINNYIVKRHFFFRTLEGWRGQDLYETLAHEITHFFHYCIDIKKSPEYRLKHPDPFSLLAEAVAGLKDYKKKKIIVYPPSIKFSKYIEKTKNHDTKSLHDYGHFMAFFIGLSFMKNNDPDKFRKQHVYTKDKEKFSLSNIALKELLKDEYRPLFFQNLPLDVTDSLIKYIMNMTPIDFILLYQKSARQLGIPNKHFLIGLKPFGRIMKKKIEEYLIFSS